MIFLSQSNTGGKNIEDNDHGRRASEEGKMEGAGEDRAEEEGDAG